MERRAAKRRVSHSRSPLADRRRDGRVRSEDSPIRSSASIGAAIDPWFQGHAGMPMRLRDGARMPLQSVPPLVHRPDLREGLAAVRDAVLELSRRVDRSQRQGTAPLTTRRERPPINASPSADVGQVLATVLADLRLDADEVDVVCPGALRVALAAAELTVLLRGLLLNLVNTADPVELEIEVLGGDDAVMIDLRGRPLTDDRALDQIIGRILRISGGSLCADDRGARVRLPRHRPRP